MKLQRNSNEEIMKLTTCDEVCNKFKRNRAFGKMPVEIAYHSTVSVMYKGGHFCYTSISFFGLAIKSEMATAFCTVVGLLTSIFTIVTIAYGYVLTLFVVLLRSKWFRLQ